MGKIKVKVLRHDPEGKTKDKLEEFEVSVGEKGTVLETLMKIYDTRESSLAFDYGCRAKNCGLCVVNINGHPQYACIAQITTGAEITPLKHLPLIRDLVFDRRPFFNYLRRFRPYIVREKHPDEEPETLLQPPEHSRLMSCRECFACLSSCPNYDCQNDSFGGPLGFVKLAQLHYDRRDCLDRVSQAREMGILNCIDCSACTCISGIPINKIVIRPLLELLKERGDD